MKPLKIGLDFDGVIADTSRLKQERARLRYGVEIPTEIFKESLVVGRGILTLQQYRDMMRELCGTAEIGLQMDEMAEAIATVRRLRDEGHALCVITSREGSEMDVAQEWLRLREIDLPFISVGYAKDKVEAARDLDAYLDDDLNKLLPLQPHVRGLYLFHRDYNAADEAPERIRRIQSWPEFYTGLSDLA